MIAKAGFAQEVIQESEPKKVRLGQKVRAAIVRDLERKLSGIEVIVVARMDHVSTQDVNGLRQTLSHHEASFFVVKNSLCQRVFRDLGWAVLGEMLEGTCGVSPIRGDVGAVCKLLAAFSKGHEGFVLRGGFLKGQILQPKDLSDLARIPSRETLLSQLAGIVQSPLRQLAFVLHAPIRSLAMTLAAVNQKKEKEENVKG